MATENDDSLEQSGTKKEPDLAIVVGELQQAAVDCNQNGYNDRMAKVNRWWHSEWDGQWEDGRMHAPYGATPEQKANIFPWEGASDSRLHIVSNIITEHVTLALTAFWTAKVQAKSIRPFSPEGREASITQHMLDWRIYTHMKRELLRELPLAFQWKYGGGLSFIGITWEQSREINYVPISMDMIGQITQALGLPDIVDQIRDPDKIYDDQLVPLLQKMSPILPTGEARKILNDLRNTDQAQMPTVGFRVNKPKWIAKRPVLDILFPSETSDIQQARWISEPELVDESTLIDRIETDGYDPDFVDQALKHKGEFSSWMTNLGVTNAPNGSDRDMVQLHHTIYQRVDYGVPCKYKVIFNEATIGSHNLYAVHRKFEYDHQQYPVVALRRSHYYRPLLSSIGIADEAYTDEWDIKRQQDSLNNRCDIIAAPPMVVPTLRAHATASNYGPKSVMTAPRPEQIVWQPLPPMDATPLQVMQIVQDRLDRRYGIIGGAVDPEIKSLRRQQLANDVLGEMELCTEMTLQLMQEYEVDADVQKVAGGGQPWQYSVQDIQGQYEVTATVDMKMIDLEYAKLKMGLFAQMLPFRESGGTVFNAMAQIVDPDMADELTQDQASPVAMEKEKTDEYSAVGQILAGMEARKPQGAMNQLRMQTIQEIMQDPMTMQKVQQDPVAQKRLQNRIEYFQQQINQYQTNPQIGRALSTQTFSQGPTPQAPVMSQPQ